MSPAGASIHNLLEPTDHLEFYTDTSGTVLSAGASFYAFLGLPSEDVLNKRYDELFPAQVATRMLAHDAATLESGGTRTDDEALPAADGSFCIYEIRRSPWWDAEGTVRGVACFCRDVTEQRALQRQLKDLRARMNNYTRAQTEKQHLDNPSQPKAPSTETYYQELYESLTDAVFVHEIHEDGSLGRIVEVNDIACERLGYTRDELLGMTPAEFDAPQTNDRARPDVDGIINSLLNGESVVFEQTHRAKDGRCIPVEIHASATRIDGRPAVISVVRDITDRKRAEEALRDSEERYRRLFEQSNDAILVHRGNTIVEVNSRAEEMFGYPHETLTTMKLGDLYASSEDRPRNTTVLVRTVTEEGSSTVERRFVRADGSELDVDISSRLIDPETKLIRSVVRDITDRKRAEKALRESEEKYRLVAENAGDMIWRTNAELTRYTYVSPSVIRLIGHTPEMLMEVGLLSHLPEQSRVPIEAAIQKRLQAEREGTGDDEIRTWDTEYLHKDGHCVPVESTTRPLRDKDGRFLGLLGITRDITDRKRAEEALRESEERFRSVVQNVPEAILILVDRKVAFVNIAGVRLFAAENEGALLGRTALDLVAEEDRNIVRDNMQRIEEGESVSALEIDLLRDNGRRVTVEATGTPVTYQGRPGIQSTLRDITDRKQAEAALIQAERLAAVGTLVSGVAHQFNNINAAVLGYAELMRRDDALPEHLHRPAQRIIEAAVRAGDITENLLKFSAPKKRELYSTSLQTVTREALSIIAEELESQGVGLELRFRPTPSTTMNPAEIGQILVNLILNARHAVLGNPEPRIVIETGEADRRVFVRIRDNGCGISSENLSRIFSPFFTTKGEFASSGSPQDQVRGSGLGLSVCHTIAERHNGEITVETEEGEGSAFTLWLPIVEPSSRDSDTRKLSRAPETARVLVLDDDPSVGELLGRLLRTVGYDMQWVDNGAEGLTRLQEGIFDIVLVDLQMPGMSGEEFLNRLGNLPAEHRPIPLVVTGLSEPLRGDIARVVFEIVRKPFSAEHLLERIQAAIALKRWNQK